jgi:photosystem II stability/assembly factor-like uncharacterized protein
MFAHPAAIYAEDAPPTASTSATVRAMRNDATLFGVCFVSPTLGWAVGDRGVIWHTNDGGRTWHQQDSTVACSLSAVHFIDANRGWVVGGESLPQQSGSRGVVLRTRDGGATWTPVPQLLLPRLNGVKFFDANRGAAFGDCAEFHPSGVFVTRDAGASWQPLAADAAGDWLAGDFLDQDIGAFGGPAGQIATFIRGQVTHSPLSTTSLRSYRAMRLVEPTRGWAVGDGGMVLMTHDAGRSWQTPPTDLPQSTADQFDFHAVAVLGSHVWVAGAPSTRIFHSPDDGQTWESIATGQTTPIRALTFVDAQHGWAVGDLGIILVTHDGGHTWHTQRSGGQRAALLAIFAQATDVPLELVADAGAVEGYITAVNLLATHTLDEPRARHSELSRCRGALLLSGAASADTAWRFPLPAADLALGPADLLPALNRENDGRAIEQFESHLVRMLRMWRPDVVLTHHGAADPSNPLAALVEQLVARAVSAAADPAQHAELTGDVGLAPWQVKKVYGVLPTGARGDDALTTGRFSPWLGAALSDFVSPARRLLVSEHTAPPDSFEMKLLFSSVADTGNSRGLFGGIALAPGSDARRPQIELPTQDLESLRRLATRRRHLQELMERAEGSAVWAGQINNLIDGLSPADGGNLLVELADGYRQAGRLDLAADTYFLFARRYPDHPLVDRSLDWLVKFYASSETAQRLKMAHGMPALADRQKRETSLGDDTSDVRQASAVSPIAAAPPAGTLSRDDRLRRAIQLADYLKTARPALYAEPSLRFAETAAQRELGYANPAQRFFLTLKQLPKSNPWRECAASEEWLAQPAEFPPAKTIGACRPADRPPILDGAIDEQFWTKTDHLRLSGDEVGRTILSVRDDARGDRIVRPTNATVQLAYDSEFLYLAIQCPKSANLDYSTDAAPRPRDADLTQHDRVTMELDIDRDYGTAFEFTVDHRGWTHDACWGDATWNPTWFVAAARDDTTWTIEAAIPLAELVAKPPAARHVWAVSARRTVPKVGYQLWSGQSGSNDSPARFGLLIFE